MDSDKITVTNHRLKEAIRKASKISNGVSPEEITQKIDKNSLKIGVIEKYYTGTNEVSVNLLEDNKSVRCELIHSCLSSDANVSFTPRTYEDKSDDESEFCLVPYDEIYCAVLLSDTVNICLGYLSYNSLLDSDASSDEILLKNNENIISITDEFININSDNLIINGLPFSEPFLENYDDSNTLDSKLKKKQEKLVNQENIASINGYNLLDGGNIEVGGGGTGDYNQLVNKPRINNIELQGNKSLTDLGINIPSKTSDLVNDSDYIDSSYHDSTKVDKEEGKGLSSNDFTTVQKQKLSSLENYDDSEVRNLINTKVDKITGKGLSSNDYTTIEKNKLASLENYDDSDLKTAIQLINSKISPNASSINKLTDTNFVNSSIATNTAYFIGTFESEEELKSYQTTLTMNDYAFVKIYDEIVTTEIKQYDRWKYDGEEWIYEYTLNNSSFTNEQWTTINSGLNSNSLDNYYTKSESDSQISKGMSNILEQSIEYVDNQGYVTSDYHDSSKADVNHTHQDSAIKVTTQNYGDINQDTFNSYLSYDMLQLKSNKQDKLVSGTNIKTINNQNLLGSGNITIQGGGGDIQTIIDTIYPVGSIYMSVNDISPSILFGGFWKKIEDMFLLGSGSNYSLGETGGSKDAIVVEHNHTQNAHSHKPSENSNFVSTNGVNWVFTGGKAAISGSGTYKYAYTSSTSSATISEPANTSNTTATNNSTGESGIDKNMPPYLVVNVWERISSFLKTCFDADYLNNTYLSYDEDTNTLYCPSVHEYYSTQTFVNYDITSGKMLTVEFTIDNSNTSVSGADRRGVGIYSGRNQLSVFRDIRNVLISSTDGSELDTGKNYFTNTYSNVKLELVGTECSIWIDDEFVTSITHTLNGDIGLYINKWQWGRVGVKDFRFSYR